MKNLNRPVLSVLIGLLVFMILGDSNQAFALHPCGSNSYSYCSEVDFWLFPIIGLPVATVVIIVLWKKVYNH
jgi:hypothetical protein